MGRTTLRRRTPTARREHPAASAGMMGGVRAAAGRVALRRRRGTRARHGVRDRCGILEGRRVRDESGPRAGRGLRAGRRAGDAGRGTREGRRTCAGRGTGDAGAQHGGERGTRDWRGLRVRRGAGDAGVRHGGGCPAGAVDGTARRSDDSPPAAPACQPLRGSNNARPRTRWTYGLCGHGGDPGARHRRLGRQTPPTTPATTQLRATGGVPSSTPVSGD